MYYFKFFSNIYIIKMVIISDIQLPKDSDGILKVSDVSTSAQGDLSARTDITNPSTSTFVKTDSDGRLNILESNIEGAGASNSLNSTEYPVHQIGAFDGSAYRVAKCKTDGKLQVEIIGNTSSDGSGDSNVIHTDSNGNIRVSTVSTVNTAPANNSNSGITDDPANSYAVGLRGRTDIAQSNSETFLKCDAQGHLQTDIVNTANVKFEDISSSLNSGTANDPPNSLAVGLRGRTDIAQSNSETFLKCDAQGHLQVDVLSGAGGGDASEATLSALNNKVSQGADATLSNAQQVVAYGRDQSGNLDALNVDNNGHLKITLNDIESGIVNSINTISTRKNVYSQVLTNVNIALGNSTTSSAITAINGSSSTTITIYIHTGAGTTQSNFSYEVHKSYDGTHYFLDSNFTFSALGADVNANNQPAVVATYGFDAQFIRVKVNNTAEGNATAINAYINERQ